MPAAASASIIPAGLHGVVDNRTGWWRDMRRPLQVGPFRNVAGAFTINELGNKTHGLHPPYASSEQKALREYYLEGPDTMLWPRVKAQRYFLAGGGSEEEFEAGWNARHQECARDAAAITAGKFHSVGGFSLYLTAARRPPTDT